MNAAPDSLTLAQPLSGESGAELAASPECPGAVATAPGAGVRLRGVRVVCFYPWNPFEPTGAWSRFWCLWNYLLGEGAEVTLAFLEKGPEARLANLSVRYLGGYTVFSDLAAIARTVSAARTMAELKNYTPTELDFLLRYEKRLYLGSPQTGAWLEKIVGEHDIVTCEYPMYAPMLSDFCKKAGKSLIVTSHDTLFELHGSNPSSRERLKQKELHALGLADALVFCNDRERALFAGHGLNGTTVLITGDVLAITPGREDESRDAVRTALKLKTAHYCLFVGTAHGPNLEAVGEVRRMAKAMPEVTFVIAGNCLAKTTEDNLVATGFVAEDFMDTLYRGALAIIVPLLRGTGMSVKTFQAFIHGKAVVATPVGARGHTVADGRELLIAPTPAEFPAALRRLLAEGGLRQRLGQAARAYAVGLDYRTHFRPYGDLINQLLHRPDAAETKSRRSLVVVDNNLSDRVGHHFNYALALKEQCATQGEGFKALINRAAPADVMTELSADAVFAAGLHDDLTANPFPAEWGNIRSLYDFLLSNDHFARDLEAGLARTARVGDVVFLPNATPRQMLGVALLLLRNPIYRLLDYVLILRYTTYLPTGPLADRKVVRDKESADRYALAIERLEAADRGGRVRLATDSAELAKEYGAFAKRPVEVLPIPHTTHPVPASWPADIPVKQANKKRIVYLGDAREEKGFEFLLPLVRAAAQSAAGVGVEFVFQAFISSKYHYPMGLVAEEMAKLRLPNVHLVRRSLTSDEYQVLLASADLVLLPYDAATYRGRTSGPFVEAICANKPVVIPRESWMSAQLRDSGAGVTFASGNVQDLQRAVFAAVTNLAKHTAAAAGLGEEFRAYHNPQTFVRQLMQSKTTAGAG